MVAFIYHNLPRRRYFEFGSLVGHKELHLEFDYISRAAALRPTISPTGRIFFWGGGFLLLIPLELKERLPQRE